MGLKVRLRLWRERRRLRSNVPSELRGTFKPPYLCAYWHRQGRDFVMGIGDDGDAKCSAWVCLAEIDRQRDSRIERMVSEPEGYFAEARERAEAQVRESVKRDLAALRSA